MCLISFVCNEQFLRPVAGPRAGSWDDAMMAISLNSYYKYFYISAQQARTITNEISKCLFKCPDSLKNRNNKTLEEISLQIKKRFFFSIQLEIVASFANVNKPRFLGMELFHFRRLWCVYRLYTYFIRNATRCVQKASTKQNTNLGLGFRRCRGGCRALSIHRIARCLP